MKRIVFGVFNGEEEKKYKDLCTKSGKSIFKWIVNHILECYQEDYYYKVVDLPRIRKTRQRYTYRKKCKIADSLRRLMY